MQGSIPWAESWVMNPRMLMGGIVESPLSSVKRDPNFKALKEGLLKHIYGEIGPEDVEAMQED